MLILKNGLRDINVILNSTNSIITYGRNSNIEKNNEKNKEYTKLEIDNSINSYINFNFNREGGSQGFTDIGYTYENSIILNRSFFIIKFYDQKGRYVSTNYIPIVFQSIIYSTFDLTSITANNYMRDIYLPINFLENKESFLLKAKYFFFSALDGKLYFFSDNTKKEYIIINVADNKWSFDDGGYFINLQVTNNRNIDDLLGNNLDNQKVITPSVKKDTYFNIENNLFGI